MLRNLLYMGWEDYALIVVLFRLGVVIARVLIEI
jgi:hypothetical protein